MNPLFAVFALFQIYTLVLGDERCNYCKAKLELGIVLDSSSSISRDDFSTGQKFLQSYINNFFVDPEGVRVSLITYGRTTHPEDSFNLTTYSNNRDVEEAIGQVPHRATTYTATGEAIKFMREQQLSNRFSRRGVQRAALVITDGNSQETGITAAEAQRSRDEGIEMFAIGVGLQIDIRELVNIAGSNDRVDRVDSYNKLQTITDWLVKLTCVGERL